MTALHADQLIDGYLARLRVAAADLPASVRDELIDDMRAHITEARARESDETDATILNILDRLGEPEAVVTEAARRPDVFGSGQPSGRPEPYRPGILEIAALVLLPFLWPVGVVLLWISPAWKIRDKVVGTVLPPGGYPGLLYLGLFLGHAVGGHTSGGACVASGDSSGVVTQVCSGSGSGPNIVDIVGTVLSIAFLIVLWLLPVITAAYLGIRLRWGRGQHAAATA
jgi:uncharacterized membrane protein